MCAQCMWAYMDIKWLKWVTFLGCSPLSSLRRGLSVEPELLHDSLASHLVQDFLGQLSQCWNYRWALTSALETAKPSPQSLLFLNTAPSRSRQSTVQLSAVTWWSLSQPESLPSCPVISPTEGMEYQGRECQF